MAWAAVFFSLAMFLDLYFKSGCFCVGNVFLLQKFHNILWFLWVVGQYVDRVIPANLRLEWGVICG